MSKSIDNLFMYAPQDKLKIIYLKVKKILKDVFNLSLITHGITFCHVKFDVSSRESYRTGQASHMKKYE